MSNLKQTRILDTAILCQKDGCAVKLGAVYLPALGCRVMLQCPACQHISTFETTTAGLIASVSEHPLQSPVQGRRPIETYKR